MNAVDRKTDWIANAPSEVLERILATNAGHDEPSQQYPLGGQVHIDGIGHIATKDLRAEVTRREMSVAYAALERCYGIHEGATEEEQAWGLKASEEDAVLAILSALYPKQGWANDAERIYRLRDEHPELADEWYEILSEGADLEDTLREFLPILAKAMDRK